MDEVENTRIVKAEKETSIQYLERMKEKGYLFHGSGSPMPLTRLEPQQASDTNTEWNADTAVYASGEPVWSTIFALYKGHDPWRTMVTTDENGKIKSITAYMPETYKEQLPQERGYVYILPSEGFERENSKSAQYKSKQSVEPISTVEVNIQDYLEMGGKVEWTKDKL